MIERLTRRVAIASMTALVALASACSSGSAPSVAESGVSAPTSDASVVTAPSSGAGDTIAFCSLASDTTRSTDSAGVIASLTAMASVAPSSVTPSLSLVTEAWSEATGGADGVDVSTAVDELEAYVLEECGVVAVFDPPSN